MRLPFTLKTLLLTFGLAAMAFAGTPVVSDPLMENGETKVRPVLPTGKVLLFPVSAYDDAGKLTITATSSNPKVLVRVKTGNPLMKFVITQAANGSDPGFQETAVFQLFRDLTPETAAYIGGFAQGGFYDTGLGKGIFRIADFGVVTGQPNDSFIFQGGSNTGASNGDLGYTFDNEFSTSAMFTGSGQIAMANAGYSNEKTNLVPDSHQKGTNGSQFFITDGNVRQLDFKHTIFGQLTHGFKVLREMRTASTVNGTSDGAPVVPIQITSSSTVPQYIDGANVYTDAVLVISATAPGTSVITIKAMNAQGLSATQTFTVTAQDDPRSLNSRPFMTPLFDTVIPLHGQANIGFRVIDLERDYVPQTQVLASNGSTGNKHGFSALLGGSTSLFGFTTGAFARANEGVMGMIGNPSFLNTTGGFSIGAYAGPLYPTVTITQYEQLYRGSVDGGARAVDNASGSTVGVGESPISLEPELLTGAPGVAPAAPFVVARYRDTDAHAKATDVTAKINWGDGSALDTGTISTDALKPSATAFQVSGTHTYARAGSYDVVTTISSVGGLRRIARGIAVISASTLKASGLPLVLAGPTVANPILAAFTDGGAATSASAYVATVDWGDGVVTPGTVKPAGPGRFTVQGIHTYLNGERFSVSVRVHRAGSAETEDSVAWSSITLTKAFGTEHLPPFSMARLVAGIAGVPVVVSQNLSDQIKYAGPVRPTKANVGTAPEQQTYLSYTVQIVNTGNKPSKPGKLRLYLSLDKTVNLTASGNNPADIPLIIKDLKTNEFFLPIIQPSQIIQFYFQKSQYADYRLLPPPNETGSGYNFLVQVDYSDPLADHLPIDKITVDGKISGIIVDKTSLTTRESGTTDTFNVKLDKAPTATVNLPVTIESAGTTEGTLDTASVTFTPTDWYQFHPVTVTGKRDSATTGSTTVTDGPTSYHILIGPSTSTDPLFNGMEGPPVQVSNGDRDGNLKLTSATTTYVTTESAASASHTKNVSLTVAKKPTTPVMISIIVSNNAEGVVSGPNVTSDAANPNQKILTINPEDVLTIPTLKSFTITGLDDHVRDGDKTYNVSFIVQSTDPEFDGLYLPPLSVTNTDDGTLTP